MIEIKVTKSDGPNSELVITQVDKETGKAQARLKLWISENVSGVPLAIDVVESEGVTLVVSKEQ